VVVRIPVAVRYVALLFAADNDAVGVPELTLVNANFADPVAVAPSKKSSVVFLSKIEPFAAANGETVLSITHVAMPVTIPLVVVTQEALPLVTPALPLTLNAPTSRSSVPAPPFGFREMVPVLLPPIVSVLFACVCID